MRQNSGVLSKVISLPLCVMAVLIVPVPASYAATITLFANLTGALEVPPVTTPGTGNVTLELDTKLHTMQIDVTFDGLLSPTTRAHIHCCLASPFLTGVNAPVATTDPSFPGFPIGMTSGTYSSPVFNLLDDGTYNPPFITDTGGTVNDLTPTETAFVSGLLEGRSYFNLHTDEFGAGEIRGFLAVPGPVVGAGLPGLVLACGAFLAWWRRRTQG